MVADVRRYDFSPTVNAREQLRIFSPLISFSLYISSTYYCLSPFPLRSRDAIQRSTLTYFPFRSRPFSRLLRAAKCTAGTLIPLREKPDNRISFTDRLSCKWFARASTPWTGFTRQLSRPDSRIYRTHETMCRMTSSLCMCVCVEGGGLPCHFYEKKINK